MRPLTLSIVVALLAGACASEEPGIAPDRDRFYFPVGLALDPVRPLLYVANSNADLMYNGGTLAVLDLWRLPADLRRVGQCAAGGAGCPAKLDCAPARIDGTSWECDEAQFIQPGATLRMGDFPSAVSLSSDGRRVFVPVRGQNYLLWADVVDRGGGSNQVDLRCDDDRDSGCGGVGQGEDCPVWDCDTEHRVSYSEQLRESLPSEPFGMLVNELTAVHVQVDGRRRTCRDGLEPAVSCDCDGASPCQGDGDVGCCQQPPAGETNHVYLAHLYGGEVSLLTSSEAGVTLRDIRGGFFGASTSGIRGSFAMAPQRPGDAEGRIYLSSRVNSVLAAFLIRGNSTIVDESRVSLAALYPGNDSRGLAFAPGGDRLYVVNRQPPSLVAFDMSADEDGFPEASVQWVEEVCAEPSLLRLDHQQGLAYVVCFGTAQIFVVDTAVGKVVDQIATGKGPNELLLDGAHNRAFVSNFLENTVGVIDLDPTHETYRRMVVRIGLLKDLVKD